MKLVIAIIKPFKRDDVRDALTALGVHGMTVTEAKGFGRQKGHTEIYRGAEYAVNFLPKLNIEVGVEGAIADNAVAAVGNAGKTGQIGDGPVIGTVERLFLQGMAMNAVSPLAKTIPESVFMLYQMPFAVITVALVAGSVADRMRFSAYLWFVAGWLMLVYVPIAHWVWGGGFLSTAGLLDFAGGTVVHLNAGIAGLVACYLVGSRHGY